MAEKSIHELELAAAAVAHKELLEPLRVAHNVLNLASELHANDVPETISKAKAVRLLLLQRIQNDLRCCVILVEHGYALQAASLAAGIFEGCVTLGNIRTETDAAQWLSHNKENESFGPVYLLTEKALRNIVGDAEDAKRWYRQYQQLCMAKHLNPIIERSRGYVSLHDGAIKFLPGPDMSDLALAQSAFALERACRIAWLALCTIADSQETRHELRSRFATQGAELNVLQAACAHRWPDNYIAEHA